ncbi:2TM domain-containing protein [Lacinutrix iliipiscaria]|uniref:2TM domain-containing protein n=1 Tax=Lacinutrix iliipiscaria TaxID=1230532 RepID=A0ABW5WRV1_9FLAO
MEKYNIEPYKENNYSESAYRRAEKRLKEIKGFYWHFFWYLAVNLFISISKVSSDFSHGASFREVFTDFGTYAVWLFWGIGIVSHWFGVFGKNIFFSKDWESKKIKEFMDKENKIMNKYE